MKHIVGKTITITINNDVIDIKKLLIVIVTLQKKYCDIFGNINTKIRDYNIV